MDYGKMPVYFVPNQGQLEKQVAYYVEGKDKTLYFTADGVTMALAKPAAYKRVGSKSARGVLPHNPSSKPELAGEQADQRAPEDDLRQVTEVGAERYVVKLDFVGANEEVKPSGEDETGGVVSYFKGRPKDWKAGLPTYSRIVYRDLWPGIDLVYRGTVNRLKYEFIVHPGADPSRIRLAYRGAEGISVDEAGRLNVSTPAGGFQDDVPVAYQEEDGRRKEVRLAYRLMAASPESKDSAPGVGPRMADVRSDSAATTAQKTTYAYDDYHRSAAQSLTSSCTYGFEVGDYDRTQTIILDPAILVYCGFIGGSDYDAGYSIALDGSGNAYVTGRSDSSEATFPVTVGPDLIFNDSYTSDVFVAKVNAAGTALVYCGYIGGARDDWGYGIAVDASGSAYVAGYTGSTESSFPVTVGPDLTYNGSYRYDGFVAKVNAAGTELVYCGYIGGDSYDYGYGIAVDASGSAYVTGYTSSTEGSFPVTVGPDLTYNGGASDAFIAKVNPAGTALAYCGYIGGGGASYDSGYGIAVDASGSAYVTGYTNSTESSFPVTAGPDLTYNGGGSDAFVAKVDAAGAALIYCGYIGGAASDGCSGIAVDAAGNAYVAGGTSSDQATFPIAGGPDLTYGGGYDVIVAKITPLGWSLAYCGYIGGSDYEYSYGIKVDLSGNAYVVGITRSTEPTFPVLAGPDLTENGYYDAFVAKIFAFESPSQRSAVGDFDGDGADEVAMIFPGLGAWMFNAGAWTQLTLSNPVGLIAADVDNDLVDEIVANLSHLGLWTWKNGVWNQISANDVEGLAKGDVSGDGKDEIVGDFAGLGVWLWNGGNWTQLTGTDAASLLVADLHGSGRKDIVVDFGTSGLWSWSGGSWAQLSGTVRSYYMTALKAGGPGAEGLAANFGSTGLWLWTLGTWTELSGAPPDYMIGADLNHDGISEVLADFGLLGLWSWESGAWNQLAGTNPEYMIAADFDGDAGQEAAVDFANLGLWLFDGGTWLQISGATPDTMVAGDTDGDGIQELVADFGAVGLWLWNAGAWSQISPLNPDQVRTGGDRPAAISGI